MYISGSTDGAKVFQKRFKNLNQFTSQRKCFKMSLPPFANVRQIQSKKYLPVFINPCFFKYIFIDIYRYICT